MKNIFLLLAVILLLYNNLFSQDYNIGFSFEYTPQITEEIISKKYYNHVYLYGLDIRIKPFHSLPVSSGIIFQYSSKILAKIIPEPIQNAPHGNDSQFGAQKDFQMYLIEIPITFRLYSHSLFLLDCGAKLGVSILKMTDKFTLHNASNAVIIGETSFIGRNNQLTFSPMVELVYNFYKSLNLSFGIDYKLMTHDYKITPVNNIQQDVDPEIGMITNPNLNSDIQFKYNLSGLYYSLGLKYSL